MFTPEVICMPIRLSAATWNFLFFFFWYFITYSFFFFFSFLLHLRLCDILYIRIRNKFFSSTSLFLSSFFSSLLFDISVLRCCLTQFITYKRSYARTHAHQQQHHRHTHVWNETHITSDQRQHQQQLPISSHLPLHTHTQTQTQRSTHPDFSVENQKPCCCSLFCVCRGLCKKLNPFQFAFFRRCDVLCARDRASVFDHIFMRLFLIFRCDLFLLFFKSECVHSSSYLLFVPV